MNERFTISLLVQFFCRFAKFGLVRGNSPFFSQAGKETCGGLVLLRCVCVCVCVCVCEGERERERERERQYVLRSLHCVPLRRRKT